MSQQEIIDNLLVQDDHPLLGTVIAVQANFYLVQLPVTAIKPELLCTRRTRLKKIGQNVMVGDQVIIDEPDWQGGRGAIAQVLPRQTELNRPQIANVNQILLVFALVDPVLEPITLSRFLVKAESTGLDICLCLNKADLVDPNVLQYWGDRLEKWGYQPTFISVFTGLGLIDQQLQTKLQDKITVMAGPSGVGKSSLINYLIPDLNLRVGEVSGKLAKGRHTTRHTELFKLPAGGLLADTPGFNQPDLSATPEDLALLFPEIQAKLLNAQCQFSDCSHRDEPNCVVQGDWERYAYYLTFLQEAIARQEILQKQGDSESTLKSISKAGGQQQLEPKLASKKYRRTSRRVENQRLQDWQNED
jgi:ribosome biogenesis GTPase